MLDWPDIGQEQCGFVKDTGTKNVIFMFRMISEVGREGEGERKRDQ